MMKNKKLLLLIIFLFTSYAKGQQTIVGSIGDNIKFSQIISGSDSSLYFLGNKNSTNLFVLKTNWMLDTLWTLSYDRVSNFDNVHGYQIPGSENIFIWTYDSTIIKIDQNGQVISDNTISILGEQFLGIGGMLSQNDSLLITINFKDSIYHSGIAFSDTNLNISGYHEYTSDGISDIQKFGRGYLLKSAAIIFLDSAFNLLNLICPTGYTQYQQGSRVYSTGNIAKLNDSVLYVSQYSRYSFDPTNNDTYFIYESSGLGNYILQKDDFDIIPSFNFKLIHNFIDGRKLLLGQNETGLFTYFVDSNFNPISSSKLIPDTSNSGIFDAPVLYVNDRIYFAYKNIIGVLDTLANSCNSTSASMYHGAGYTQDNDIFNLKDTSYLITNSILSFQPQTISSGIFTENYCNLVNINSDERSKAFEVFPNPFTDYFEIAGSNFEIHTYTFTDVLGKVLARIKGSSGKVSMPNLSTGVYYLIEDNTGNRICLIKN